MKASKNETSVPNQSDKVTLPPKAEKMIPHDSLTPDQVDELRQKQSNEHRK